jgi:hypothetical protein
MANRLGKRLELTGQRFGKLVVTGAAGVNKFHQSLWMCACDCGGSHVVAGNVLKYGDCKSCGCISTGLGPLPDNMASKNAVVAQLKAGAINRGLEWSIDDSAVLSRLEMNCHWCDSPPMNIKKRAPYAGSNKPITYRYNGLDRVDNNRGYTIDNIVPCCGPCNWMKRAMTADSFLEHVAKIYRHSME